MKYKVCDRVKIKQSYKTSRNIIFDIMTISHVRCLGNYYRMQEDNGYYEWTDDMIEGLADECKLKELDIVNAKDEDIIYENLVYLFTMEDGTHICVRKHELEDLKGAYGYKEVWKTKDEKKERKLMMTDQEWESFQKNNNLN